MTSTLQIALSGMQAQTARLYASAESIARPAVAPNGNNVPVETADPAQAMVDMIDAEHSFKASLDAFETGASLWDVLLSVKRD